jgi:glycosyltransferase involved in cell wall biosynthesis
MKPQTRVTIGMCIRNAEATISEAIDSVLDQDFPHHLMELIVVDGHSTDDTMSIAGDCLANVDIASRVFEESSGLGVARQIVVDQAAGDYIVWVDGDMTLSKDFVSRQVEFMDQHHNVAIAKGTYELNRGLNLLSTLEIYSRAADKMVDYGSQKTLDKSLGTSGCIYRLVAIRQVGGFDRKIRGYGEDWDAEYRVRSAGWSVCTVPVYYRDYERLGISSEELWRRYWRKGYDLYYFFQKYKRVIKVYKMLPLIAFVSGLLRSRILYKRTRQRFVFLLPIQYIFKMTAWWTGYVRHLLILRIT